MTRASALLFGTGAALVRLAALLVLLVPLLLVLLAGLLVLLLTALLFLLKHIAAILVLLVGHDCTLLKNLGMRRIPAHAQGHGKTVNRRRKISECNR